jgi:hypothetical protein
MQARSVITLVRRGLVCRVRAAASLAATDRAAETGGIGAILRRLLVTGWHGSGEQMVEIVSATAVWNHPDRRIPIHYVLVRDPEGELEPQLFLCTDLEADPLVILRWFVRRWSIEVTFAEVRRHLGVETQRQWSEPAIARTTPVLRGLFSLGAFSR